MNFSIERPARKSFSQWRKVDAVILCYCNAFNRGALSAATLRDMGYHNARFIAGGLNAYRKLS